MKLAFIFRNSAHYRAPLYSLLDKNFDIDFFFCKQKDDSLKSLDFSILKNVRADLLFKKFIFGFYFLKGVRDLQLKKYTHVFIAGDIRDLSSWYLLFKCKLLGIRCILWSHGFYGKEGYFTLFIKSIYYNLSSANLFYGHRAVSIAKSSFVFAEKCRVIYNSLNYDLQFRIRKSLASSNDMCLFENDYPVIIFVGRLLRNKKLETLFSLKKNLEDSNILTNLLIVGEGPELDALQGLAAHHDLSTVHFFGACYDEAILASLFHSSSICVSPGNVGLTCMHSLVYGTPVFTSSNFSYQMPEFEAIRPGITGDFFDPDVHYDIFRVVRSWLLRHPIKTVQVQSDCFEVIDKYYNPTYQLKVIKEVLFELENF